MTTRNSDYESSGLPIQENFAQWLLENPIMSDLSEDELYVAMAGWEFPYEFYY